MAQKYSFNGKWALCLCMSLAVFSASRAFGQAYTFGHPQAKATSRNDVSLDQLKSVAVQMANKRWKQPVLGDAIPACDADGNLVAYMFVFRIDSRAFGTESSIRSGVREALQRMGENPVPKHPVVTLDPSKAHRSEKWTPGRPVPASLPLSTDPVKTGADFRRGTWEKQRYGIGAYGTVVVSAMKSRVPVPQVIHGLPPYYTQLETAAEKHKGRIGSRAIISRLIYVSPAQEYFELEGAGGKVFVNAHSLKAEVPPPSDVKSALGMSIGADEKEKQAKLISSEWEKYGVR
jgi:hypothetical protein